MKRIVVLYILCLFIVGSCVPHNPAPTLAVSIPTSATSQILFDDFSYSTPDEMTSNGWGGAELTFYVTAGETVQIEPWNAENASNSVQGSLAGWHTLVTQVIGGTVRYFIDGKLMAQHGGAYYPDAPMSINFNLWFIDGGWFRQKEDENTRKILIGSSMRRAFCLCLPRLPQGFAI